MKVLFLANIPSPYRVDFFNELGKLCELTVTYEGQTAIDRNSAWGHAESLHYEEVYLKGIRTGSDNFLCPGVISVIRRGWDRIIVGGYSTPTSMLAIEYMRLFRIKFCIQADGGFIKNDTGMKYRIKRHFISAGTWWLSTGRVTTDYLVHYGADRERCYEYPFTSVCNKDLLLNSTLKERINIDAEADGNFISSKREQKKLLGIKEERMILSVGRFSFNTWYRKGYDVLLKAAEGLRASNKANEDASIGIYIVGDEPTEEFLNWKERENLSNVHFIGFKGKEELSQYYRAADLFVLMTREDVWGLVINEAMAMGLPIITTNMCGAGLELVRKNENGFIIPVNDAEALVEKIRFFMDHPEKMEKFGKRSLEIISDYTIERMASRHIEILQEI